MTTTMREVPGPEFDSFLSRAVASIHTGTSTRGSVNGSGTDNELARVASETRIRATGTTTAAGTSVLV